MKAIRRITAADIRDQLIRTRFPAPEFAFLEQVRNATGAHADRSADVIAMSVWPSRGLEIHGIEIKVSRGDWLRERRAPVKAEACARYCHRWWIATEQEVVKPDELPAGWGLMVLGGSLQTELLPSAKGPGMSIVKQAPLLQPQPIGYDFLASILRSAAKATSDAERLAAAHADGRRLGRSESRRLTAAEMDGKLRALERAASWILREATKTREAIVQQQGQGHAAADPAEP